jgi:iron complex outermembrane receptor protein
MRISRTALLATTLLSSVAFANPAFAQATPNNTTPPANPQAQPELNSAATDQTPATQENPADTAAQGRQDTEAGAPETIVVTGSRIASPNITSLAPVQVVGEQEINQSGAVNIQELLDSNPAFGSPALSTTNSSFLTSGTGVATVNLRQLGEARTLVLINNRRVVGGLAGSPIVDLNDIPTQFLERVDILTGGQSALYGSDAIAGVVNFIYKRNFEGLLLEGQYGLTEKGDAQKYQVSATAGGNFMDGRGNIMVHVGYTNDKGLLSRERSPDRIDNVSKFAYSSSDPADFAVPLKPFFSGIPPQGVFTAGGTRFTFGPTGELQPCFNQNGNSAACPGPNGFNRQFFRTLSTPIQRYLFAERSRFDITDNISFVTEATFARTHAHSQIEPFGLTSANVNPATGDVPIQATPGGACNPFVPQPICDAASVATSGPFTGLKTITFNRRLADVNVRSNDVNRNFFRVVAALEGKLLNDRFQWDIGYNYGVTSEQQHTTGQVNVENFIEGLSVVPNGTGGFQCANPLAAALGCVPVDIFGDNSLTPAMVNWINADQQHNVTIRQQTWDANISGSIVDLPAGPLGVALGAEYRKESSNEDWDALTNAGLNGANLLPDTSGSFTVKEAYGEVNVPILKDLPFANSLNVRGAGRISDYSTIGSVKTWEVGADWAPIEDIRFRATLAKAVRAPNIGELFTGPSQTFPTGLTDPCEGVGATGDPTGQPAGTGDRCRADAGIAANIAQNGTFTLSQLDKQGISGFNGGNANLKAETGKTRTIGVVIAPRSIPALRNLSLSVDYWHIKVDDAIAGIGRQTILNTCFQEGLAASCALITRFQRQTGQSSPGAIQFINDFQINIASLTRAGIDAVLQYRTGFGTFMGSPLNMNARIAYTHLLKGFNVPLPGEDPDRVAGEIGTPKGKFDATLGLDTRQWGVSFHGSYIGKSYEDDVFLSGFDLDDKAISIKPIFYLDGQVRFTPVKNYEFYVGVDNLFNTQPPIILQGNAFNTTGSNTDESVYDVFGRRYYAGVRLRF